MGEREGELLRLACLSLKDIADAVGVPHTTVRNWSVGRIEIPRDQRSGVAAFMREHAGLLVEAAEELEG